MSKVAKWVFPIAGGKDGVVGTAKAVVGFITGEWGLVAAGVAQVGGFGKKKQAAQERQASVTTLSIGEVPREAVLGQTCTAGSLIDVFSFGGKYGTDTVTYCVALADHAIDGIVGYYVDDQYYPWVGEGLQAAFSNKLSLHFRQATVDGHEPPLHVLNAGAGWTVEDRNAGIAHIWIDTHFDDKVWARGWPKFKFVLRGLRVFDPRFDPALGYSGPNPQTWENRASHKFSTNATLLRYAVARGIYAEGHHGEEEHLLIGRGLSAEEAPPERVIAAANLCDELVNGKPRYAASGVISAADDFATVEEMFAVAMAGVIVQREGGVEIEPGHAKAAVVTITDDDLATGEAVTFSHFLPDGTAGRINTVVSRYIEPALGYKDHAGPVRRSIPDIQKDRGPREMTLVQPLVTDVEQADRNAEIARLRSRCERRSQIVLPPDFAGLEEGDWIAWKSDRYHGGATVRYLIETFALNEKWRNGLALTEIAASVFGGTDPIEDVPVPPPAPTPIDALALTGVTAEAIQLAGEASIMPAIRMGWNEPDGAVRAIRAEVRIEGQTESAITRTDDVAAGVMVVTNGVAPGQFMQARLVPIGEPSRPVLASPWLTVSTAELAADINPDAPALEDIRAEARAKAALLIKEAASRWNRDETDKKFAIENVQFVSEKLAIAIETLMLADEQQIALIADERQARIDDLLAETTARLLQISGVEDALAIVDDFSRTTATALAAETETRNTQVSSLGTSLGLVDAKASTAVSTANAAAAATTALASEVDGVEATATMALTTAADAASQLGDASFAVEVAAGGDPAMIYARAKGSTSVAGMVASVLRFANTVSGTAVEAMRLFAGEVFFMRPIYIDVGFKRLIVGPGNEWVLWFGPNTISAAAATRTNGHWAFGSDGKVYYGASELGAGGGGFHVQADAVVRTGTRTSPGLVTTSSVRFTITGATGTVTWSSGLLGGAEDWVATNASGTVSGTFFESAFRASVSAGGEIKRGQFAFLITDSGSGKSFTIPVTGVAIYNI